MAFESLPLPMTKPLRCKAPTLQVVYEDLRTVMKNRRPRLCRRMAVSTVR
jgi:hypothetical protein